MGVTNSNKLIDVSQIACDGTLKITLSLAAAPDITSNPVDIVLVLDRSGSMAGSAIANLKLGAKKFIDIIDQATDGSQDGNIGGGSRIGIVSFADTATKDTQLITSVADLKAAVDALTASGNTNHADAFTKATELLTPPSGNGRVMVMFTDGKTTTGLPPSPVAAAARAAGITIYCIGLIGTDGIDVSTLNDWATDPDTSHVAVTPDDSQLEDLFEDLAQNISKPGATNIVIHEVVNPDFNIINVLPPSKGNVTMVQNTSLQWNIDALGTTANEGAALEFIIRHVAQNSGDKAVNQSITYQDSENNVVNFPDPVVKVDCGIIIHPEDCPTPIDVAIDGCNDSIVYDLGDSYLDSLGRILQLDVNLKNICPGKRVALAILLTEVDQEGNEYKRGLKAVTVPAHQYATCKDIQVKCIKFVLPEDLNTAGGPQSMCSQRNFKARIINHYVDSDFDCCGQLTTTVAD